MPAVLLLSPGTWEASPIFPVPTNLTLFAHFFPAGANYFVISRPPREAALLSGQLQRFLAVELGLADELLDAVGEALRGIGLGARVGGGLRADQERDFAASGAFLERRGEFGEFAAAKLFVQLRHFARYAGAAIAQHFAGVGNTPRDPVRSFVKDDRAVLDAQVFKGAPPFATSRGQKSDKQKFLVGQPRS